LGGLDVISVGSVFAREMQGVQAGYAIPTILVTAYPDDDVRARALNDGSFATFASPLMRSI
jgi:hypothetical protein